MAQLKNLKSSFSASLRNYGQILFKSKALDWATDEGNVVSCYVNDGDDYLVQLGLEQNCVYGFCGCDTFEMGGLCSHLWTVLLAAEELGTLFEKGGTPPLFFAPEESAKLFDLKFNKKKSKSNIKPKPKLKAKTTAATKSKKKITATATEWKKTLASIQKIRTLSATERGLAWPKNQQLLYVLNLHQMKKANHHHDWIIQLAVRSQKPDGSWSNIKSRALDGTRAGLLPDRDDREIISMLTGAIRESKENLDTQHHWDEKASSIFRLTKGLAEPILERICETGRAYTTSKREGFKHITPVSWDGDRPWDFILKGTLSDSKNAVTIQGAFHRKGVSIDLHKPLIVQRDGYILIGETLGRLRSTESIQWYERLKITASLTIPLAEKSEFLHELYEHPTLPKLDFPSELQVEQVLASPKPRLRMNEPEGRRKTSKHLIAHLSFRYANETVDAHAVRNYLFLDNGKRLCERDFDAEQNFREQLLDLEFTSLRDQESDQEVFRIATHRFQEATAFLLSKGWHVEAHDKPYRQANDMNFTVTSDMDWFDLQGSVSFDGLDVALPELLTALKNGDRVVSLGDGSYGMLPETWLGRYGLLAGLGEIKSENVRFKKSQAPLLDALLADTPSLQCDSAFQEMRNKTRDFKGVKPLPTPTDFIGTLRPYQQTGLGWFTFLNQFGFGGCLADDMGLGKTIQVLALLEERRAQRANPSTGTQSPRPSLIVVPKSIVFNWQREANRFTPKLKILIHTGGQRQAPSDHFNAYDLILSTYGTVRNDIEKLQHIPFDYVILDESQAIKNQHSAAAKAVRLLKRRKHALTMTGTPIENHLGELWSQFEFLNPGMLGRSSIFKTLIPDGQNQSNSNPELLARTLRPFILRRTKKNVAPELPEKFEQTLYCDLPESQQRQYNELKLYYQQSLLKRVQADGISKSKIHILEALLRLRQAACHPGLLDEQKQSESSAKLDILIPRLTETVQEGHKALVFSQFTSFLSLVRKQLDPLHISYEYLDGKTQNRQERVDRFQNDSDCKLFLISLKAGGIGLNLTAAQSVFLWIGGTPPIEAQAIDRSHRIGQTQNVFAFRLIARGTVEEKVLALQKKKQQLAESIINADNSLIRSLKREDLELLLS